ncbi:MAG: cytochrome c biogenesis protein CcsA [candidate division Zixibacteria bacterium]|nr:cytochrome c biogenesis protein CcsA [candidate division Zixibacteria bacterium]
MPAVFKYILLILMSIVIVSVWITSPPQRNLGDISRIFYFHVPVAWISVLAFAAAMVNSILYLKKKNLNYDIRASISAKLGLMFSIIATVSGAIFAKATWMSYWNWDPRQTSILILILIYGAYLALRSAVEDEERRAALSSVYSIIAFVTVPFLVFVIPRVYQTLHPTDTIIDSSGSIQMSPIVLFIFLSSIFCFTLIYAWLYRLHSIIEIESRNKN